MSLMISHGGAALLMQEIDRRMSPELRAELTLAHEECERREDELRAYLEGTEWTPEQKAVLEARRARPT